MNQYVRVQNGIVTNEYQNGLPAIVSWCKDRPYYRATHRHESDGIRDAVFAEERDGYVLTNKSWALVDGVWTQTGEYVSQDEYDAQQETERQDIKPQALKDAENAFFGLCYQLYGDYEKRGFDELNATITAMLATDKDTASALAIKLLAIDAECKREGGNSWWDDAVMHEVAE